MKAKTTSTLSNLRIVTLGIALLALTLDLIGAAAPQEKTVHAQGKRIDTELSIKHLDISLEADIQANPVATFVNASPRREATATFGASQPDKSQDIIVPGVRVGDYTLGMSKDEVLKKLGEPQTIELGDNQVVRRGQEEYSPNNLPSKCILSFGDVSVWIRDASVEAISVHRPVYKLGNGLGVGASEQSIKQALGENFSRNEVMGRDYLCYPAKGLAFLIHEKDQAATEIVVYPPKGPKVGGPRAEAPTASKTFPKYDPDSGRPFQVDLRARDVSKLDLRESRADLMYADFDDRTLWPAYDRMPSGFDWRKIMELGKNPGLGVRRLHEEGITGRAVRIAIIDQPLLVDHREYAGRVRLYEEMDLQGRTDPTMHGAAVASIALGKTVGVAPEAELYYIAMQFIDHNTLRRLARSVDRIVQVNRQLPEDGKIRVISVSKGWLPSHEGYEEIMEAVHKAQAAGMLFLCTNVERVHEEFDFATLGRPPLADPDVFESYEPGLFTAKGFWARPSSPSGKSFSVPMDSRTTASPAGVDKYAFYRIGGMSWAVPYVAGVYALAVQADPAITPERFWALAVRTGRTIELERNGARKPLGPILGPVRLIRAIRAGETATLTRPQDDHQTVQTPLPTNSETQTTVSGVRVGDSVDKVKQVYGNDFWLREFETKDILTYEDKGLSFEINKNKGTVMEINVFQAIRQKTDSPGMYGRDGLEAYGDVGGKDLRASDLRDAGNILDTLGFNEGTLWPLAERLPKGFDPQALLQEGMNPGLGVRALHAQGITGSGVHVGLIDQPLLLAHPEYAGKIVSYHVLDCGPHKSSMHGPAMTSYLVGQRCGTAPGVNLHVVAVPSWKTDAGYYAQALDLFVAYNEGAPKDQRIRVVSVSAQPSGEGSVYKNQSLWHEAVQRATDKGILVLDCTWQHGFVSLCWLDPKNRESVEDCTPGFRNGDLEVDEGHIHVPSAPRTAAEAHEDGRLGYAHDGGGRRGGNAMSKGGYSDTIPYAAGILALGWQIRPDLSPEQMKELLFASAYVHPSGAKIIHPAAFIELVRNQSGNQPSDRRSSQDISTLVRQAAAEGRIAFNLTTPEEIKALLGLPTTESTEAEGDKVLLEYPGLRVRFFGKPGVKTPHTVLGVWCAGRQIDIGEGRPVVLRDEGDLDKFGPFWGYSGVDLSRLDLSRKGKLLRSMPFDSFTVWPPRDLLPPDFDPRKVMEWGKDAGLRVRQLHAQGITGQGVHVAIIDQPLLLDHIEYQDRLAGYTDVDTVLPGPTMHGAGVASLLAGKTCGTAPGAILHFWGVPSWKRDYRYWCRALEQILAYNKDKKKSDQIRVLSVSKVFDPREPNLDQWRALVAKAEQTGIYVIHCSKMGFGAGCRFLEDSNDPANYQPSAPDQGSTVGQVSGALFTPLDQRTTASHKAKDAYTFWLDGGLSWGAPYIAGVVACGLQVNPDLPVDQIDKLLRNSGWDFHGGKLINPPGFVDAARRAGRAISKRLKSHE